MGLKNPTGGSWWALRYWSMRAVNPEMGSGSGVVEGRIGDRGVGQVEEDGIEESDRGIMVGLEILVHESCESRPGGGGHRRSPTQACLTVQDDGVTGIWVRVGAHVRHLEMIARVDLSPGAHPGLPQGPD